MKKNKKLIIVLASLIIILLVLVISFFTFGGVFLKIEYEKKNSPIEVPFNSDNFKYPDIKCTFFNENITGDNFKIVKDIDLKKIGNQTLEYECKKMNFKKTISIEYKIIDNIPPEIKLNGEESISLFVGDKYEDKGATANDNVDGEITEKIIVDNKVDSSKEGEYDVTYSITDSSGHTSTVKRSVVVKKKPAQSSSSSSSLGCGEAGVIYLTFDDGPNSNYTPVILDVLKKYNVKATFFVTSAGPDSIIKREFDEGHAIGLHSSSHAYEKIYVSSEAFWKDMNAVRDRVVNITGTKPNLLRFPGGVSNTVSKKYNKGIMTQLAKEVENNGYAYFDWNISSGDAGGTTDPNVEYKNVVNSLSKKRGNVILMHDIKKHTSQAIENIVKYGLDNGYSFKVLDSSVICHQRINN